MSFGDHVHRAVMQALKAIPAADAPGIYALSFFIYDEDDEPQQPALTVGYNTESQVKHVLDNAKDRGGRRYPDPAEARWNYAYWLQNELAVIGDSTRDPEGAAQRAQWIQSTPRFHGHPELITARFVTACVRMTHSLHEVGLIERAVGHPVPVLIHELEYYEQIAKQTEAANPPGLADGFAAWVRHQQAFRQLRYLSPPEAIYPQETINGHRAFIARRRAARPSEESYSHRRRMGRVPRPLRTPQGRPRRPGTRLRNQLPARARLR